MNDQISGIDLHAHTTASDGSLSPTALVELAHSIGLSALAVTDHDTIAGLAEATEAASNTGLDLVSGVELSVEDESGRFHLLGYLFQVDDATLAETLIQLRHNRAERNTQMAAKMAELGLPVTMADVQAEAGEDSEVIARPHFAQALIKKGIVTSVAEAFDRFLATGKPLYLPKQGLTPAAAIKILHDAGGLAVMAHPGLIPMGDTALAERIQRLKNDVGLDGIEAYYSQHSASQTARFLDIARQNDLLVTAGSDFHGTPKPHVPLGVITNQTSAPIAILEAMRARLHS